MFPAQAIRLYFKGYQSTKWRILTGFGTGAARATAQRERTETSFMVDKPGFPKGKVV